MVINKRDFPPASIREVNSPRAGYTKVMGFFHDLKWAFPKITTLDSGTISYSVYTSQLLTEYNRFDP